MTFAGLVKRAKSHFENCNNGPEETPVQGECSYILTPRATGAARPSPAGPECKKQYHGLNNNSWLLSTSIIYEIWTLLSDSLIWKPYYIMSGFSGLRYGFLINSAKWSAE